MNSINLSIDKIMTGEIRSFWSKTIRKDFLFSSVAKHGLLGPNYGSEVITPIVQGFDLRWNDGMENPKLKGTKFW